MSGWWESTAASPAPQPSGCLPAYLTSGWCLAGGKVLLTHQLLNHPVVYQLTWPIVDVWLVGKYCWLTSSSTIWLFTSLPDQWLMSGWWESTAGSPAPQPSGCSPALDTGWTQQIGRLNYWLSTELCRKILYIKMYHFSTSCPNCFYILYKPIKNKTVNTN